MEKTPRIIQGESETLLILNATAEFGVPETELTINYINAVQDGTLQAVVFPTALANEFENMDGTYHLYFKSDGTFFELLPARGTGKALNRQLIEQFFQRKKLRDFKPDVFDRIWDAQCGYEKIAGAQTEIILNEDLEVTISQDEMLAFAALLPPEEGGEPLTKERAMAQIAEKGVTYGIDEDVIDALINQRQYYRRFGIARGVAAVDGQNGYLKFHFEREHVGVLALLNESDKVDYKNLDLYAKVKAGDKLVTKVPATEGTMGYTVKNKPMKPKQGKDAKMPRGERVTYNQDKSEMYAAVSGRADYHQDRVVVSNVLQIDGDVDLSVGNIDFDGDVMIKGNVISGFTVKATGRIEIKGNVQRAEIYAGGDIVIINGIQGMDSGFVETYGTLTTKFVERGKVKAKISVIADQIIHSQVECGGEVVARGEHGAIIGGVIKATSMVAAKTIGTENQVKTAIEVGINPSLRNDLAVSERELKEVTRQVSEREKICNFLSTQQDLSLERQELMRKTIQSKLDLVRQQEKLRQKCEDLSNITANATDGKVHVTKEIFPGVSLIISMVPYRVSGTSIQAATFRMSKGDVSFGPCEITL